MILIQGEMTFSSDVWSFGVMLWEIMTLARRSPHHQLTSDQVFHTLVTLHSHATCGSTQDYAPLQVYAFIFSCML